MIRPYLSRIIPEETVQGREKKKSFKNLRKVAPVYTPHKINCALKIKFE